MSVAIVAQFPWRGVRILGEVIAPFCLIYTDTRVTTKRQALRPDLPKQFRLSKNLIACYTSSNMFALTEALFETATSPTCGRNEVSTRNDVQRLGRLAKKMHGLHGGFSEILAVLHEPSGPSMFELMPPSYTLVRRQGIIGIGSKPVLKRFRDLYELKPFGMAMDQQRAGRIDLDATLNLACAFSQAIEEVKDPTVDLPIQITAVTKEGMFERKASILRKASTQLQPLTANEKQLRLPEKLAKAPTFAGKRRSAVVLVGGCESTGSNKNTKLKVYLKKGNKYALYFAVVLEGKNLYAGTPTFAAMLGSWMEYYGDGYIFTNSPPPRGQSRRGGKLDRLTGRKQIIAVNYAYQSAFDADWDNWRTEGSSKEKTLTIDIGELSQKHQRPFTIELWAVEKGQRQLLVNEIVSGAVYKGMPVLDYMVADWTNPPLVIVVWTLTETAWRRAEVAVYKGLKRKAVDVRER